MQPLDKKGVAAVLEEMGTLLELQGANVFKSRAFHNAARVIEGVTGDLAAMAASGELREVKGIGKSLAEIITELVTTGASREHAELKKGLPPGLLEMLRIQGLGPKRVKVIHEKLKIRTLDELEQAARGQKLAALDGFGAKTEENILKGIEALRKRSSRTLYPVAADLARTIHAHVLAQKGALRGEIAGSLRRRRETIGDIDIVLSSEDAAREKIMEAFVTHPLVESVVARGETKSTVILSGGVSCDLRLVTDREFPFTVNYSTGSKEHNVALRTRAKQYGLSLNEYGFTPLEAGKKLPPRASRCADEKDIYAALGLAYVPPELRENFGEIEAAEAGELPALVDDGDIRGTFHCHTTYSDGVNSLAEMAAAAKALGWKYLGIADHSKAAAYAGGLTEEKLQAQFKEIDALNDRMKGFRLFRGTECDILPNGDLDWPERILARFEYVVISVHSNFRMTEAEMTKRIIKALKNKHVTMLGHPTGRLLLARDEYPVNMTQVIDAASDYGKIIEINAHPMRLDLDWRLCRYARDRSVMISINPDAHSVEGLRDVSYGVGIARKGWLRAKDILNTRDTRGVAQRFEADR